MSSAEPELSGKVLDLLNRYLAETGDGGMVTNFFLIAEWANSEGGYSWLHSTPHDQPMSRTMGLVEWARGVAHHEQRRHLETLEDE